MRAAAPFLMAAALAASPTVIKDPAARARLLGPHGFTVQWVQWGRDRGRAMVEDKAGTLTLKGEQRHAPSGNWATIDGVITEVEARRFRFRGRIELRVDHIAGGRPCLREGDFTFRISGARRFWRLKEMANPCAADGTVDYVDVHF
jgi:hypothetical protein